MSYARFSPDSDVYVIRTADSTFECVGCLQNDSSWTCETRSEMIDHLMNTHRAQGDSVPEHALERLSNEVGDSKVFT